ncbi:MAG: TonB family protein [Candidatus Obscuribacterales bacterium]|nr:TonB family protein [Candidatus Obscuribacterales bacterium]
MRKVENLLVLAAAVLLTAAPSAFSVPAVPSEPSLPSQFDLTSKVPADPFAVYLQVVQQKVQEQWTPEGGEESPPATVTFQIDSAGKINTPKLKRSSGSAALDRAALSAISKAAPFAPLQDGVKRITINYAFDTGLPKPMSGCTLSDSVTGHLFVRGALPRDVELGGYVTKLQSRVLETWKPKPVEKVEFVEVRFKLDRNGNVVGLRPNDSKGFATNTESAIKAITQSAPFEPVVIQEPSDVYVSLIFQKMPPPKTQGEYKPIPPEQPQFDPLFATYIEMAQYKVRGAWHPVNGARSREAVVGFTVLPDGRVTHVRIAKSAGAADVDKAAIDAVLKSAPFGTFPKGDRQSLQLHFTFEDRADPSKQRSFELKASAPYSVIIATPPVRRRRF